MHEDLAQTLRLILHDGFLHDEPDITAQVKRLAAEAPSVFKGLVPPDLDVDVNDEGAVTTRVVGDLDHVEPNAMIRISAGACKALGLPVREGQLSRAFDVLLSRAYTTDYKTSVIVTGNASISYWKKLSFAKRCVWMAGKGSGWATH